MSRSPRKGMVQKNSLVMKHALEERGIDLIAMQMEIYSKAMSAFDREKGCQDGGDGYGPSDVGFKYLEICNNAVKTMMSHCYPKMTAIAIDDLREKEDHLTLDASKVRDTILNDPFAVRAAKRVTMSADIGLPDLPIGEKKDESD